MATQDQLDALHRATNIPASDTTYTDELLASYIDETGSVAAAAAQIWREIAAATATFVDTTESGSSRKLSDLHKNALAIAAGFDQVGTVSGGQAFTVAVERQ